MAGIRGQREDMGVNQIQLSYGILAGGESRRMGRDKADLIIEGQSFVDRLAAEFDGRGPLMVSVRDEDQGKRIRLPYITDVNRQIGPLEGIHNLLTWSPTEFIFICACDTPYLRAELAEYLVQMIPAGYDCCALRDNERVHPLPAVYSRNRKALAGQMIAAGNYRVMSLLEESRTGIIDIRDTEIPAEWLLNINTQEAYDRLNG